MTVTRLVSAPARPGASLGRMHFATSLLLWLLILLTAGLLAGELFGLTVSEDADRVWEEPFADLALQAALLCIMTSLMAQRVRDLGLPVIPVVTGLVALELAEWFVLPKMGLARMPEPLGEMTLIGAGLSIASLFWLLLWPGSAARTGARTPPA